jgi:hypothetical protein
MKTKTKTTRAKFKLLNELEVIRIVNDTTNKKEHKKEIQSYISDIERIIDLAETTSGCYFWTPSDSASGRRASEDKYSFECKVENDLINYDLDHDLRQSCKHVYVNKHFYINDTKYTLAKVRSLLKELETLNMILTSVQDYTISLSRASKEALKNVA